MLHRKYNTLGSIDIHQRNNVIMRRIKHLSILDYNFYNENFWDGNYNFVRKLISGYGNKW